MGRPQSQLGGLEVPLITLCPLPNILSFPHPVWPKTDPPKKHGCCCPAGSPVCRPSPHAAPHTSVAPPTPLRSLFLQSNPSSCRLNLHTKDQCKDHQLCGSKSRVHSKTCTHWALTPVHGPPSHSFRVWLCDTSAVGPVRHGEHCESSVAFVGGAERRISFFTHFASCVWCDVMLMTSVMTDLWSF